MSNYLGGGYSHHLSVEAMVRLHNEAVLRYLGDERHEKLSHVQDCLRDFFSRAKTDKTIDTNQIERATQLQNQVAYDLSRCISAPEAEEDESPNEP